MKTLIYCIIILGILEIVSNLFHLSKKTKEKIGLSAKRQHQELSLELGYQHFYIKALIMLFFGFLFTVSGLVALSNNDSLFFYFVLLLFAIYGIVQALYYRRSYKVWMSLVVYILPFVSLILISGNVKAEAAYPYGSNTHNSKFIFPFKLSVEPIKRILVINFDDDSEYEMMEPQLYNDSVYGRGLRVLMYRNDKKVDVYWQPGVNFDTTAFAVGKGMGNFTRTEMSPARFEFTDKGIDINIAFTDVAGRRVELIVKEQKTSKSRFPFLAPVAGDVEKPTKLFMPYMQEFDFVKREGCVIKAKVGNRNLVPSTFPINREGDQVYFARYSSKLVIGEINSAVTLPIVFEPNDTIVSQGNQHFLLNKEQKIMKYWINTDSEPISIFFDKGFPNLLNLPEGKTVTGKWNYQVANSQITGGIYTLLRKNNLVTIEFDVNQKWKPKNLPFSMDIFTYFMRSFRVWPTTYKWCATVNLNSLKVDAHWVRK